MDSPTNKPASPKPPRLAAFRHRNFRLFWLGNLVSLIGTLAQQTAQGWLVRELTPDPRLITIVAACNTLPVIFLSLPAGALADRVDRRRALLIFNVVAAIVALALAGLVAADVIAVWHVVLFALVSGVGTAFDVPIRQSFNREMVEMEDLPSAIALNSTAFNTARVAGPAVAGVLISGVGLAECFFINAFSFIAIIIGLALMNLPPRKAAASRVDFAAISEGVLYVRRHETLRLIMMLVAVVSFGAMSFGSLMPIFAKDVFQTDARGFSFLMTCNGLGALAAAAGLSVMGEMRHKGKRLLLGAWLFCLTTFGFAIAPNLVVACGFLILSGYFLLTFLMTANTLVQTLAPDAMRGRIFSVYSLSLIGASPLGAIAMGALAKGQGARAAVAMGTLGSAVFVVFVFWKFRSLWKER